MAEKKTECPDKSTEHILKREVKSVEPSLALKEFQRTVCPDVPLDSKEITFRLIEEIVKLKREMEEKNEKKKIKNKTSILE